jgi:Sap, sulfolipid-1-addressing protein
MPFTWEQAPAPSGRRCVSRELIYRRRVMSMLPYLAAVGVITVAGPSVAVWLPVLAAYVLVMVLPALLLLGVRLAVHRQAEPVLRRLSGWLGRRMDGVLGWVLAIIGVLLAGDAAVRLGLFGLDAAGG